MYFMKKPSAGGFTPGLRFAGTPPGPPQERTRRRAVRGSTGWQSPAIHPAAPEGLNPLYHIWSKKASLPLFPFRGGFRLVFTPFRASAFVFHAD